MAKKIITAKESFDNAVQQSQAEYVDEVAGIHYWYKEIDNHADLYIEDPVNKTYTHALFPAFDEVISDFALEVFAYFKEMGYNATKQDMVDFLSGKQPTGNYKAAYCDYLYLHSHGYKYDIKFEDVEVEVDETSSPESAQPHVVGAEHTDVCAISEMLYHIKSMLITRIKAYIDCMDEDMIQIDRPHDRDYFNDINVSDNGIFLKRSDNGEVLMFGNSDSMDGYGLHMLNVDELLHIYSQLRS